ncbi:MAG: Flp family type IVb pilin [Planctomycetota bacterium]|jgi:Flp pilus assembly pilin Flp
MKNLFKRFMIEEDGLEPVEYALMLALAAIVMVGGAYYMAGKVDAKFDSVGDTVDGADAGVTLPGGTQ